MKKKIGTHVMLFQIAIALQIQNFTLLYYFLNCTRSQRASENFDFYPKMGQLFFGLKKNVFRACAREECIICCFFLSKNEKKIVYLLTRSNTAFPILGPKNKNHENVFQNILLVDCSLQ